MADVPLTRRDLLTTKGDLYVHDGTDLIRVGVGADDQVLTADAAAASGVKWAAGGGGGSAGIVTAQHRRTAGNISIAAASTWQNAEESTDIAVPASIGDWVEVGVSAYWVDSNNSFMDVATLVSGSLVSFASTGDTSPAGGGVQAWVPPGGIEGTEAGIGGSVFMRPLTADDIAGSEVTLRLRIRSGTTSTVLRADGGRPLIFWAKNYGPSAS